MGLALYPNRLGWRHGLLCVIIFGLSIMNKWTFPLSFLSAGVVSLLAGRYVCAFLSKYHRGDRVLLFLEGISMFMFVLNAQIRNITLRIYEGAHPNVMLLGACVHLMIVILVAAMYGRIHMKKFHGGTRQGISKSRITPFYFFLITDGDSSSRMNIGRALS